MTRRKRTVKTANFERIATVVLGLVTAAICVMLLTSFVKYPEKYLSTWRYQLQNDIARGDEAAIEYYESTYVANGIKLFGEE